MKQTTEFDRRVLALEYMIIGVPADRLAYTPELDRLCAAMLIGHTDINRRRILDELFRLRKSGRLPCTGGRN
ncbi:MAG: hypothetical protein ACTHLN_11655 [Tepidisphaeraceae bacterium]